MSGRDHRQAPSYHGHNAAAEKRMSGGGPSGMRNPWVWVRGVSNSTTTSPSAAATASAAAATNPDAPNSATSATCQQQQQQQQHWPPFCFAQNPPTSHQQRSYNPTAFKSVLGEAPWHNAKPSALERVEAAVAARKKLPWGGGAASGTEKSPGFRMRVDSDDGISDHQRKSIMALGRGYNRKRNCCPTALSKQSMKKQKQEESRKHILSLDKLQ